ncbi:EcsC family protein [Aneurinibacillus migulanus]|uniref:EcsC family protein n=1 Tax=Aneurinibacillus migulanus TaxID=47500 RepID=UPI0020A1AA32|nr:EcsC family protein [Aneurinibacillus migulanus]MCP1357457.1 EcsC family protein [Aneurinibacillus migulanus]
METRGYLQEELEKVKKWENEQKDLWFWEKLGRIPFKLLDCITPAFVHEKIGQALDEVGNYIQTGGRYLISEREVLGRFPTQSSDGSALREVLQVEDVAERSLQDMDKVADELRNSRKKIAIFQGATTGIGGIFTLAVDIPALLGLSLKVLQEVAVAYGYDPKEREERLFIVKCMQFASSDVVGKQAIIDELSAYGEGQKNTQTLSQLQGWREVVLAYRDNFGWKKLFQIVPIAGIVFGAYLNKSTIEDVAETGMMLYRKRRIMEKLAHISQEA